MKYPEHEKLAAIQKESQAQGCFIDWLHSEGYTLCKWDDEYSRFLTAGVPSITNLLAEYHGIDQKKLEKEKVKMLEEIRKTNQSES